MGFSKKNFGSMRKISTKVNGYNVFLKNTWEAILREINVIFYFDATFSSVTSGFCAIDDLEYSFVDS